MAIVSKIPDALESKRETNAIPKANPTIEYSQKSTVGMFPKKDGKLDYSNAMTGDDLLDFVNQDLFPYLAGFGQRAAPTHHRIQNWRNFLVCKTVVRVVTLSEPY